MLVNAQPTFYSIMNSSTAQKLLLKNFNLNDHILRFYSQIMFTTEKNEAL